MDYDFPYTLSDMFEDDLDLVPSLTAMKKHPLKLSIKNGKVITSAYSYPLTYASEENLFLSEGQERTLTEVA